MKEENLAQTPTATDAKPQPFYPSTDNYTEVAKSLATDAEAIKALDAFNSWCDSTGPIADIVRNGGEALFGHRETIRAALARMVPVPDGWKLVPIEPTEEMLVAALDHKQCLIETDYSITDVYGYQDNDLPTVYKAMIAAAPPADREG